MIVVGDEGVEVGMAFGVVAKAAMVGGAVPCRRRSLHLTDSGPQHFLNFAFINQRQ